MNSCYGALLNSFFRYFRVEMGASVTATGRQITTHMMGTIGELLTGKFSVLHRTYEINNKGEKSAVYKVDEDSPVIYGDTDSSYFFTYGKNQDDATEIADTVAEGVNDSFEGFMKRAFNCQSPDFSALIKAGREIIGKRGLFQAKKKYVIDVVDMDGVRKRKLKTMGSEIKKSDTPKMIQHFLKDVVNLILDGQAYNELEKFVNDRRKKLFSANAYRDIIQLGVSKAANNLDAQYEEFKKVEVKRAGKVKLPGHIRAACNYNELAIQFDGNGAKLIQSGDKVKIFYVKPNFFNYKSVAFPAEILKFPKWFVENFEVDSKLTEEKMVDAKLESIFSAWGYDVPTLQNQFVNKFVSF